MANIPSVRLNSGNTMPVFGLGTWMLTIDTAATVGYALELGYPMIDTSSDYGTQPGIGRAVKSSDADRAQLYIVTKVEETDDAYARTRSNLAELGMQYVDMMLIHRPPYRGAGQELWDGLIRAREEGLCRDIGVSNYSAGLVDKLIDYSGVVPAVNQIEWSPFGYSREMKDYCDDKQIVIQAYSPLTRAKRLHDETLVEIGRKYGKSPAQILIRWNIQLGTVPIPKANRRHHLEEDIAVFDFGIEEGDMRRLENLNKRYSALGYLPYE